jgi:hypothetical protein
VCLCFNATFAITGIMDSTEQVCMAFVCCLDGLVAADVANTATPHLQHVLLRSRDGHGQGMAANAAVSPSNAVCRNY